MHGLNLYDYSARYYEPALGRFTSVDPKAEKYYSISPYAYCANNPLRFIDPSGMSLEDPPILKQAVFAIAHPIPTRRIGTYKVGANNISTYAGNFGINLTKAIGKTVVGEGNYNNAIRHATWQAIISKRFGEEIATVSGNAHEKDVMSTNLDLRTFSNMSDADKTVDLLNNIMGRGIGKNNPKASNSELVGKIIDEFANNGLWTVSKTEDGNYTIQCTKLTKEEHKKARGRLKELGNDGLTKKDEDEKNK